MTRRCFLINEATRHTKHAPNKPGHGRKNILAVPFSRVYATQDEADRISPAFKPGKSRHK